MPTLGGDFFSDPSPIQYAAPNVTWKVEKGSHVGSSGITALSTFENSKIVNNGTLYTIAGPHAISFEAANSTIVNRSKGVVIAEIAINVAAPGTLDVVNKGTVLGSFFGMSLVGPSDARLENDGYIYGGSAAVLMIASTSGFTSGPKLENTGVIESDHVAIGITIAGDAEGKTAKVTNSSEGVIKGGRVADGNAAIQAPTIGAIDIQNKGRIKGDIDVRDNDDKIVNKGILKGDVYLGDGDDTFRTKGDGKTKGILNGQQGNDKFVLGASAETIVFDTVLNALINVDRVKKFDSGTDRFQLDKDIFASLSGPGPLSSSEFRKGTSAQDGDDHVIYDKSTGALYYDQDGVGGIDQVKFAQLDVGAKFKASDVDVIA